MKGSGACAGFWPFDNRHTRRNRAVSPNFHNQLIVVGALTDALSSISYFTRITGEKLESTGITPISRSIRVFVGRAVAAAVFNLHFHVEKHIVGQGGDDMFGIDDLHVLAGRSSGR